MTEYQERIAGQELVELLKLKPVPGHNPPRYDLLGGEKTALGVYRSIVRVVDKHKQLAQGEGAVTTSWGVNKAFFQENPDLDVQLIPGPAEGKLVFTLDTLRTFEKWKEAAVRDGRISLDLAKKTSIDERFGRTPKWR